MNKQQLGQAVIAEWMNPIQTPNPALIKRKRDIVRQAWPELARLIEGGVQGTGEAPKRGPLPRNSGANAGYPRPAIEIVYPDGPKQEKRDPFLIVSASREAARTTARRAGLKMASCKVITKPEELAKMRTGGLRRLVDHDSFRSAGKSKELFEITSLFKATDSRRYGEK